MSNEQVARMIAEAMHARDKKVYELLAYCIMPNHVYIVFTVDCRTKRFASSNAVERSAASFMRSDTSLYRILQSLKAYTARRANEIIGQKGAFWQHESYDHVVRNGKELERIIDYFLHNPVKRRERFQAGNNGGGVIAAKTCSL